MVSLNLNLNSVLASGVPTTQPPADPPALHMVLLIGEATVTFKTVQTPSREAFFSKKKPQSSPVMRVHFKGCHGRFSIDPKAKFFGFYQGFMGIESYIIGKCTCSKFQDPMSNPSFGSVDSSSSHKLESLTEVSISSRIHVHLYVRIPTPTSPAA